MLDTDETLSAGVNFMNLAMIARFGQYTHPIPEIQKFVRKALDEMEGSWHESLDEMFSAEWAGFSVTEQVWKFDPDFDGVPAFVPKKLVTYAPLTLVFAVNRHGDVLPDGIYQYQRFHNTFMNSYVYGLVNGELDGFRPDLFSAQGDFPYPIRIAADLTYLTVKIPQDHVIHLKGSSTGKFNSPYGKSKFRAIYKNWVSKDAFLKMWLIAADRKGTPLIVGWAKPNDTVLQQNQKPNHNHEGAKKKLRSDQAMAATFKTIHNSSFIVLPGKKDEDYSVEAIQVQGDMNIFKDAVEYFNKAEMRGLLIPSLVLSNGDGVGSNALGQEHAKVFNKILDGVSKPYKQGILFQFIRKIIAYNFPEKLWRKHGLGDFIHEEFDPEVMEKLANIFRTLCETGFMSPEDQNDMNEVRQKMNLKPKMAVKIEPIEIGDDGNDEDDDTTEDKPVAGLGDE